MGNSVYEQYIDEEKIVEEKVDNSIKPEQNLIPQENNIIIEEQQIAGNLITIRAVSLLDNGYFTINAKDSDALLGSSTILKIGIYKNTQVLISDIPAGDNTLVANLYFENGTKVFSREFLLKKLELAKPKDLSAPYTPQDVSINVVITDFDIQPKNIVVNLGDRVTLNIANKHKAYEMVSDLLDINTKIPMGESKIQFTAKEAGIFRAFCPTECEADSANSRNSIEVRYKKLNISG